MIQRLAGVRPAVEGAIRQVWAFLFGSVFRFLILLGLFFHAIGAFWATGITAGHLAIYGSTSLGLGIIGLAISWWKVQEEY